MMALEMRYQAVPETWDRLQVVPSISLTHSAFAFAVEEKTTQPGTSSEWPRHVHADKVQSTHVDFARELLRLIRHTPGLQQRNVYIGQHWDMLHFLLSPQRRQGTHDINTDWIKRAILGGEELKGVTASGDVPVFFMPYTEVQSTSFMLNQVTRQMFVEYFNIQAMIRAGVYASLSLMGRQYAFEELWESFSHLRDFYMSAAANEEGVVAYMG
ncbi:MAG: DUF1877 family protein [Anaerolineae bacterium]